MGAGIAADPLSPDFDPLDALRFRRSLVIRAVWFRRPLHLAPQAAARFRVSVTGAGCDTLAGLSTTASAASSASIGRSLPSHRLGPYMPDHLPPGDERRASGHRGQHPSFVAGTRKDALACRSCRPADAALSRASSEANLPGSLRSISSVLRRAPSITHKLLMFRRFPASASSAYSHDAVIESESRQAPGCRAKLWIMWISCTSRRPRRDMNETFFPVHATAG